MSGAPCAFDVAIVGGGPAGTATALFLVKACGIAAERIVIFDKARHPREKPCGGAVSGWGVAALMRVGIDISSLDAVRMDGLRILDDEGRAVGVHEKRGLGAVVRRDAFDALLWRSSSRAGIVARDGESVSSLERTAAGWKVKTSLDEVSAHFVVAADGAGSTVRRLLGVREPARKAHLLVVETPMMKRDRGPEARLCDFDLSRADTIEGYYWDFPCRIDGAPYVSRGVFHANLHAYRDLGSVLRHELGRRGVDVRRVAVKPFSTRPFVRTTTLVKEDVLFVGEAAGVDAATGEGIAQAILFGEIAARHLARALREGRRALAGYPRDVLSSRVGKHLLESAWLARHVYGARGLPFRRLLVNSSAAREAGARWYHGDKLGLATWALLGARLAGEALRS